MQFINTQQYPLNQTRSPRIPLLITKVATNKTFSKVVASKCTTKLPPAKHQPYDLNQISLPWNINKELNQSTPFQIVRKAPQSSSTILLIITMRYTTFNRTATISNSNSTTNPNDLSGPTLISKKKPFTTTTHRSLHKPSPR